MIFLEVETVKKIIKYRNLKKKRTKKEEKYF